MGGEEGFPGVMSERKPERGQGQRKEQHAQWPRAGGDLDNREEVNKFLETYRFPRLKEEETENLNGSVSTNEMESVIGQLQVNTSPGPEGFPRDLTKGPEERGHLPFSNYSEILRREGPPGSRRPASP